MKEFKTPKEKTKKQRCPWRLPWTSLFIPEESSNVYSVYFNRLLYAIVKENTYLKLLDHYRMQMPTKNSCLA